MQRLTFYQNMLHQNGFKFTDGKLKWPNASGIVLLIEGIVNTGISAQILASRKAFYDFLY